MSASQSRPPTTPAGCHDGTAWPAPAHSGPKRSQPDPAKPTPPRPVYARTGHRKARVNGTGRYAL